MLDGEGFNGPCEDFYQVREDSVLVTTAPGVLDNDPDGAILDLVPASDPTLGVVELFEDGSFIYTPNENLFGEDMFEYTVMLGADETAVATVHINIIGENDPPQGNGGDNEDDPSDAYTVENIFMGTDEERLVTIEAEEGVLANDEDPDGDELIAVLDSGPANGVLDFREDGSFDYTPDDLFAGDDTFTYFADDGQAQLGPVTVTITVELNPPLEAFDDEYTTFEDVPLVISAPGVLENDVFGVPNPLTAGLVEGVQVGSVFLDPTGGFTYTPLENWSGDDVWNYVALRSTGEEDVPPESSEVASVLVHVIPVDDPPEGGADEFHLLEGGEFEVGLFEQVVGEPVLFPSNSTYYQYVDQVASWAEAEELARELEFNGRAGQLAKIDAPEITQFLSGNLPAHEAWIAGVQDLTRLTPEDAELPEGETPVTEPGGAWTWLGRQAMEYTNWAEGQPNGVDLEVPDAAAILPDFDPPPEGDPWHWSDISSESLLGGYYVEFRDRLPITEGLLANDFDVEGDPIAVELDQPPANGALHEFTLSGGFRYEPADGFSGEDVFTYLPTWNGVAGAPTEVTMVVHQLHDVPGDSNYDGMVDLEDFNILKENFGVGVWPEEGDADADGDVDLGDFALLKENFGFGVEEPTEEGETGEGDAAAASADQALLAAAAIDQVLVSEDADDEGTIV